MQTVTITIYKFDELSEDAKKRALEQMRDNNTEVGDWWQFVYEDWQTKLEENGFFAVTIYFSGFWSQGDGASFEGKVDVAKWLTVNKKRRNYRAVYADVDNVKITITKSGRYEHEMTMSVDCEYFGESAKAYKTVDSLATEI